MNVLYKKKNNLFLTLLLLITLASCSKINAYSKSTDHFVELKEDTRILYETNAKDIALHVSNILEESIKRVETAQNFTFCKPIKICICETETSFAKQTGVSPKVKAAVFKEKVFLSADLRKQPERIKRLTIHELSHLNIIQKIGKFKFVRNIPSWFSEGLAVYISNGGGAENVSESSATHSIINGKSFYPDNSGSLLLPPKTASSYNLTPHMFYRQASMFVQYMHKSEPTKFKQLLSYIYNGEKFESAFSSSYGVSIQFYWEKYKNNLTSRFKGRREACGIFNVLACTKHTGNLELIAVKSRRP